MLIAIQLKISTLPPTHGFVSQTDEKVLPCPLPLVFWHRLKKKFNSASYPWFSYPGWWKNSPLLPTLGCVTQADENVIICLVPQGCVPQVDEKVLLCLVPQGGVTQADEKDLLCVLPLVVWPMHVHCSRVDVHEYLMWSDWLGGCRGEEGLEPRTDATRGCHGGGGGNWCSLRAPFYSVGRAVWHK